MDYNDTILARSNAGLVLLIDTSVYIEIQRLADETGYHTLNFILKRYPNIDFYFSEEVFREINAKGVSLNSINIVNRILMSESIPFDKNLKVNMGLYNSVDGQIKSYKHNTISHVDHSQILLCQNHLKLVLLSNDHRLLKSAAPVLKNRIMDLQNLFELLINTENNHLKKMWSELLDQYMSTSNYKRPKHFRSLPDNLPNGRIPSINV